MSMRSRPFLHCFCVLLFLAPACPPAGASRSIIPRDILAFYDGETPDKTLIHRAAELPLNHLGYIVRYQDIRAPLPPAEMVADRYAAVLIWFTGELKEPRPFLRWAASVARRGTRFIILDNIGGDDSGRDIALTSALLEPMGLRPTGEFVRASDDSRIVVQDDKIYDYEAKLGPDIHDLPSIVVADPRRATALVEIEAGPAERRYRSVVVAAGAGGGYVAPNSAVRYNANTDRLSWLLDPFRFFALALGTIRQPIPDVTTVVGRRLYFSHVDGDGWNNGAQMPPYREAGVLASEVMLKELIEPYPDLPVTIGLIVGDVLAEEGGNPATEELARRIYSLPQVEVGSHTFTHPFRWSFYEPYDRTKEVELIEKARADSDGQLSLLGRITRRLLNDDYVAGGSDLPRAYLRNPFDLGREVDEAIQLTERLAPAGKRLKVYQWSGNARPFEAAIARTRSAGVRNINGGDSRFDAEFPSVIYVAPVGLEVGKQRQIYAVNSNENTYTNDWAGPYYAFRNLEETVRRTDAPRRLKGFNVYYHTYSAERQASLDAVKALLDLARGMRIAPVATSQYAAIADGFFDTRIARVGQDVWTIGNRGALNTVRFDDGEGVTTDLAHSEGVLGESRHAGSLYVALDPNVSVAKVAIERRPSETGAHADRPMLIDSRWLVSDLKWESGCSFSYSAQGYGRGEIAWRALPNTLFSITATRSNEVHWQGRVTSDATGRVEFAVPAFREPLTVSLVCHRIAQSEARIHAE